MEKLEEIDNQYIEAVIFNVIDSYKVFFGKDFIDNILNEKCTNRDIVEAQYKGISFIHEENKKSYNFYNVKKQSLFLSQMLNLLKINEAIEVCEALKPLNKDLDKNKERLEKEYVDFLKKIDNSDMSEEEVSGFNSELFLESLKYSNMLMSYDNCKGIDNIIGTVNRYKNEVENNMKILSGLNQRKYGYVRY